MNYTPTKRDSETGLDMGAVRADISALKRDVASAAGHLADDATNGMRDAAAHVTNAASNVTDDIMARGARAAKAIGQHIEKQPLVSVLLAFTAGVVLSRLLPR
jgi:ElaB/YqjD/DUF883 family membrane-anchored ribosome-binding protein